MRRAEIYAHFIKVIMNLNMVISFKVQLRFRNFFFFFFSRLVLFSFPSASTNPCLFNFFSFLFFYCLSYSYVLVFFCFVLLCLLCVLCSFFSFRFLSSVSLKYFAGSVNSFMNL